MANKQIKDLTAKTAPAGTDVLAIDDGSTNVSYKVLLSNLWKALGTGTATAYLSLLGDGSWGRPQKRLLTEAVYTTAPNADSYDLHILTAQNAPFTVAAPTGTPAQGQPYMFRFKDNGTARAITWNAIYRAMGVSLPTTTVLSKTLYLGFIYNSTDTKWDLIASAQEA